MACLFKCLMDPCNVTMDDVQEIFVMKQNYVKKRYFDSKNSHNEKPKVLEGDDVVHNMYAKYRSKLF